MREVRPEDADLFSMRNPSYYDCMRPVVRAADKKNGFPRRVASYIIFIYYRWYSVLNSGNVMGGH